MADFYEQLTNYLVFPTEQDHHGESAVGSGRIMTELMWGAVSDIMIGRGNYIVNGFTLPPNGSSITNAPVAAGSAWIEGHYISGNDNIEVDLTDGSVNYLYLKLEYDGEYVDRPLIEVNTTGTTPAHAAFLGHLTTSGGSVVNDSQKHWRSGPRMCYGIVSLSGGGVDSYDVRGGRSWTVTSAGGSTYSLTFDTGSFLNKPCAIFQLLNASAAGCVRVLDGGSNDDIHFIMYTESAGTMTATDTGTVSFIVCG